MNNKKTVDQQIIQIIQTSSLSDQTDLQEMLLKKGYIVAQATLSRRLKKLGITKVNGIYRIIHGQIRCLSDVLAVRSSEFGIIVLHTNPGTANSVAAYLDEHYISFKQNNTNYTGILATLAGDDTVLVVVKDSQSLHATQKLFKELFAHALHELK